MVVQHLPDMTRVLFFEATFVCLCRIYVNFTVSAVSYSDKCWSSSSVDKSKTVYKETNISMFVSVLCDSWSKNVQIHGFSMLQSLSKVTVQTWGALSYWG